MKKLCLLFLIVFAGLIVVAQENDTVASQGEMVRKRSKLCFYDGTKKVTITDTDLTQLLNEEDYDTYCRGRRFFKLGTGLTYGGYTAFGAGLGMGILGVHYMRNGEVVVGEPDDTFDRGGRLLIYGIALFGEGLGAIISGSVFRSIGVRRINEVANDYNQKHKKTTVYYCLSPSVIPVNIPQSQSNMAFGMTFSVDF